MRGSGGGASYAHARHKLHHRTPAWRRSRACMLYVFIALCGGTMLAVWVSRHMPGSSTAVPVTSSKAAGDAAVAGATQAVAETAKKLKQQDGKQRGIDTRAANPPPIFAKKQDSGDRGSDKGSAKADTWQVAAAPSPLPPPAPTPLPPPVIAPPPKPTSALPAASQQQQQQQQQQQPIAAGMTLEEAVSKPVNVLMKTSHFFGNEYARTVPDCSYEGRPIQCIWTAASDQGSEDTADVLWYHGCSRVQEKRRPEQLTVLMYMESAKYYSCLDDMNFMDSADLEMTYRLCSHVIVHYFDFNHETIASKFFKRPEPFEAKLDAVAYVNSNCGAQSGRDRMVKALMDTGKIPVHAHGHCLRNMNVTGSFNKVQLFRGYKFCIAIENSISKDYMTEKLWNAFVAGCVPIYLGPPNVKDFLPTDNSIVLWSDYSNADAVADELVRLMHNKTAYEEKLSWKRFTSVKQLNLGLRIIMGTDVAPKFHTQCQICQIAMGHRIRPRSFAKTHCLRNATWLANNATSFGPGAEGFASITDAIDFHLPGPY